MIYQHSATHYEWDGGNLDFNFIDYANDKKLKIIKPAHIKTSIKIESEVNYKPKKINTIQKITDRIHRDKIIPIVNILNPILGKYGRFDLCGSYRRGKETIKDMDYVIQTPQEKFRNLREELQNIGIQFVRGANEIMNGIYIPNGIGIDFFRADPDSYITLLIWRTGSKNHNIYCAKVALRQGMKIKRSGIQLKNGEIFHPKTEQEFYDCLGMKFIPPNQRDMEF